MLFFIFSKSSFLNFVPGTEIHEMIFIPELPRISLRAFAIPEVCLHKMLNGKGVVQAVIITAFFPFNSGTGMPNLFSSIMQKTFLSNSAFKRPGMLPQ